ncbi:hypothetical protein L7F22_012951 [Adiantum nelumboides]|nr:hypothetical protein [Adiantum nelumboides]
MDGPSPSQALNSRALQNLPPTSPLSSTHILPCRCQGPPQTVSQTLHQSRAIQLCCSPHCLSFRVVKSSPQRHESKEILQNHEEAHQAEKQSPEEGKSEGGCFELARGSAKHHGLHVHAETLPFAAHAQKNPSCSGQALESPRPTVCKGAWGPDKALIHDGSRSSVDRWSHGESKNTNEHSDASSTEQDMRNHFSLYEDGKGVSPLRALTHIAHIKRKQDYLHNNLEQLQPDISNEFAANGAQESSLQRKRFKQVQFQLEPLAYQKLMKLLVDQHQGSFERFITATLDSASKECNSVRRAAAFPKKPIFSKWKRIRFDQLKGNETEELALAFKSLAESTPDAEATSDLMHIPWQELNMLQVQKMLEETKKMLLINEKVHDCPFANCNRRFSTPGNLKDHLNEHSGEQPYSCTFEDCPHRFRSKQHLCRHLKKHERAHTCTFEGCNKRFAFRERLIVHQKIHSDERPLSCPWEGCGKTFKWANSLHGHMRTHTGEKPFQCTFAGCGRHFGYKVDLTRHRRTHFGQPARANH